VIKRRLSDIESEIDNIVVELEHLDIHVDTQTIKDYYTGKDKFNLGIIEYLDRIIEQKKKDKTLSKTTPEKYKNLKDNISDFVASELKIKVTNVNMRKIDFKFIKKFDDYLKTIESKRAKKILSPSTIKKKHEYFRTVLRQAELEEYIKRSPYHKFKIKNVTTQIKYLSKDEIDKIINLDLTGNEKLDRIRDIFIFSAYAGFRFKDAQDLRMDNLISDNDGNYTSIYLEKQQKNQAPVNPVVLTPVAKIIGKYKNSMDRLIENRVIPKTSNSNFNRGIKKIGALCNIKMSLHHHIARHSFATTILTENGVNLNEVQSWLGHSSINSTKIYAHVTNRQMMNTASRLNAM
ncbi:MAG: site-specific integrase, partial [Flavobacteriales bacterium]|nr:site-specific integrase [Flavobacteriales bacterium]